MTIYHLGKIELFLLPVLFPKAKRIAARPATDTAKKILAKLPKDETEFFYHFDVTFSDVWPAFRAELNSALRARGIRIYNANVTDISRKTLQAAIAAAGLPNLTAPRRGKPTERLIVKPDFNYRGLLDIEWNAKFPALFPRVPKAVKDYAVKERQDIPAALWNAEGVQIERFISNPENKFFRVNLCQGRLVPGKYINPGLIKKPQQSIARWRFPGTTRNPEIARVVKLSKKVFRQMNVDFGTVDILSDVDGNLFVCDINSTPYWGLPDSSIDKTKWTSEATTNYLRDGTKP